MYKYIGEGTDGFVITPPVLCINELLNIKYSNFPVMKIRMQITESNQKKILKELYKIDKSQNYFIYEIAGGLLNTDFIDMDKIKIKHPYGYFMSFGGEYNLEDYIKHNPEILDITNVIFILQKILFNLDILLKLNIIHADLKFPNIMISNNNIKFIDFNLSFYKEDYQNNFMSSSYSAHPPFFNVLSEHSNESFDFMYDKFYKDVVKFDLEQLNNIDYKNINYINSIEKYIDKIDIFSIGISFLWMYDIYPKYINTKFMDLLYNMTNIDMEKQYNIDQVINQLGFLI